MSNEKEIAAIEKTLERAGLLSESYNKAAAKVLVKAGYRKADEIRKETIEEVFRELFCTIKEVGDFIITQSDIIEWAQGYGITIEEVNE